MTSREHGGRRYLPYAFTEQGVAMLSAVLHSKTAVNVSIKIINTFIEMRRFFYNNAQIFSRLDSVERKQIAFESETEKNFEKVFQALGKSQESPKQGIFYDGQVYDAYIFVCGLIRKAKKSLVLIDNYADESVLSLLSKRADGVVAIIYIISLGIGDYLKILFTAIKQKNSKSFFIARCCRQKKSIANYNRRRNVCG